MNVCFDENCKDPDCPGSGRHDKPDWGHGPNEPVPMWTADQIETALDRTLFTFGDEVKKSAIMRELRGML